MSLIDPQLRIHSDLQLSLQTRCELDGGMFLAVETVTRGRRYLLEMTRSTGAVNDVGRRQYKNGYRYSGEIPRKMRVGAIEYSHATCTVR